MEVIQITQYSFFRLAFCFRLGTLNSNVFLKIKLVENLIPIKVTDYDHGGLIEKKTFSLFNFYLFELIFLFKYK